MQAMKAKGLLEKIEPHLNRVGVSYRSKAIIEPYLSKQWFVKMQGFSQLITRHGGFQKGARLLPENWESTYYHWIDNLRDWCISPPALVGPSHPHLVPKRAIPTSMICYEGEELPPEVQKDPEAWEQDPDVLDTWFSSALWPFATLGWPDETPDLKKFYPNSTLITGHDILFFWVARMLAMGDYAMGQASLSRNLFCMG